MNLVRLARWAVLVVAFSLSISSLAGPADTIGPPDHRGPPVRIAGEAPQFPRKAMEAGIEFGEVVALLHVDEAGNVSEVEIKEARPPTVFDHEVIRATSQWKFKPEGQKFVLEATLTFALRTDDRLADAKSAYVHGYYRAAVDLWRPAAERGDASAQANLAFSYETGRGVAKNEVVAAQWYRKAADQGNAFAQSSLGIMYTNGRGGLAQNDSQAVEWFRKAAEQGDALAQVNLGIMYANGRGGLPKDEKEAVEWLRKAEAQGESHAQAALKALENRKGGGQ